MAKYAGIEFRKNNGNYSREQFITCDIAEETTIQGGANGIWEIDSAGAFDITVADFDKTHFSDYVTPPNKPYVIIKCNLDKTAGTTLILNEDGDTLFTFNLDNSVQPAYCVLTLDTPTHGRFAWKVA